MLTIIPWRSDPVYLASIVIDHLFQVNLDSGKIVDSHRISFKIDSLTHQMKRQTDTQTDGRTDKETRQKHKPVHVCTRSHRHKTWNPHGYPTPLPRSPPPPHTHTHKKSPLRKDTGPEILYLSPLPLWTEWLTHASENITFLTLLLRAVINYDDHGVFDSLKCTNNIPEDVTKFSPREKNMAAERHPLITHWQSLRQHQSAEH